MNLSLNLPLNPLSFGQVSLALLREFYKRGVSPCIFPIGGIDLGAYQYDDDFMLWIQSGVNKSLKLHNRNTPTLKLWHINQSLESFSKSQHLLTFHEVDGLTDFEVNILKNQETVLVTCNYTKQVMEEYGLTNVHYIELGFDNENFRKLDNKFKNKSNIEFGLCGKLENLRKAHEKIIINWVNKYGGKKGYVLNLAVYNPHDSPEVNQENLNKIFSKTNLDHIPWNINVNNWMQTNAEYNQYINNNDIILSPFRSEGRDLPTFHSVGLGKHCVSLRAHAYLDYLNDDNAVLIEPTSKIRAVDGRFFLEGANFNQGNFFDWKDEDFDKALDIVVERYRKNPENTKGLELQKKTYSQTVDQILEAIK